MNPLLLPVGIAAGAGNYLRDTFLKNSQDPVMANAIAHINDPTYIGDQKYDEGANLLPNPDVFGGNAAFSPIGALRDWVSEATSSAADTAVAAAAATGSAIKTALLPAWVTGGGLSSSGSSSTDIPLWIKTAIVLSLIVGTAVLVKKEI